MVSVAVREEDRVDATDVVRERLSAQIGRGVDEDAADGAGKRRRPQPAVPRSIRIDARSRLSCGSDERQTAQSQPITGTPCDVPLPSTVILRDAAFTMVS